MNAQAPFDLATVDLDAFYEDLQSLRRELVASLGQEDLDHLYKIERWGRACTAAGLATCWVAPNPLSAGLLAMGRGTRWLLMHHVGHRGYDRVPGVPARYTSRGFARGRRRFLDWADWMVPEAWIYEHNVLHHAHTGEARDPDLIERNTEDLRAPSVPKPARYAVMALLALTWRASYYAPKTMGQWLARRGPVSRWTYVRALAGRCYVPYAAWHFAAVPLAFAPLGPWAVFSAWCNQLGAEALTNLHTFLVVGPNHAGEDLYRFDDRPATRAAGLARQVLGSVNYACGGDLTDWAHLWLNYQIEHHLYPDLPMRAYRAAQPRVRAICEKHGVPYLQESVWRRARKMLDVAVGNAAMRRPAPAG